MTRTELDSLLERDARERRRDAVERAERALTVLAARGIDARVVGSLARSDFARHSDIDILILSCPREWRYRLEALVEDEVGDFPFDVIYLDEVAPHRQSRLLAEARHASDLR